MKLRRMDFPLWISLLHLVLFISPLKSESSDDHNGQDKEDGSDNYDETGSSDDDNGQDNEDGSDNDDGKETRTSVIANNNGTNGMVEMPAMTTVQSKPGGMETDKIAVKVGVPVALVGMVILLGVIRLVSSGQLKDRILGLGEIFDKIPENSIPIYVVNGLSLGKTTSDMYTNQTYAVQIADENKQFGNKPTSGYEYDNTEQGTYLCDKASQAGTSYPDCHEYEEIDIKMLSNDHNTI